MQNSLNTVQLSKPNRNFFDLTHDVKLSTKMGYLTPILVQECVPGDKFTISCQSLIRFAPLVAPVMHRINVTMHYWFVPNRLVWDGWENFITGTSNNEPPYFSIGQAEYDTHKILDYMGIPQSLVTGGWKVNAMPFAAYQLIWNEWYRDQNLQTDHTDDIPLDNGENDFISTVYNILRRRNWEHDYFTSNLPHPQLGADGVNIPLGQINTDVGIALNKTTPLPGTGTVDWVNSVPSAEQFDLQELTSHNVTNPQNQLFAQTYGLQIEPTTIIELRRAFKLQEWLERSIAGGTRYIEHIKAMFGVTSDDARLQRPEYITGVKAPVIISEVLQTAEGTEPVGTMAGHGVSVSSGRYGQYFCKEHGFIIGVMSVMPETGYMQGLERQFGQRQDRFDYLWPQFAHIGEQEVKLKEVFATSILGDNTFGYIPRYQEYRMRQNRVAGDFKTTLAHWHLGRIFETTPALNTAFIECIPSDRIFAVEDDSDNLWCTVVNQIGAMRPLPKFGEPFM